MRIKTISTRGELDEFEQQNIEKALVWTLKRKFKMNHILSESFVRELHKRMYSDVWDWASEFRKSNKNIGVDKFQIGTELKTLIDDCKFWISNQTFHEDKRAIRFKHGLLSILCFVKGNGRYDY